MHFALDDKVAFIAGSTRGIGLAVARAFLAEGARVVVTGRNQGRLERSRELLLRQAPDAPALFLQGDMGIPEHAERALQQTVDRFQALDCVVANVGSGKSKVGWDLRAEDWEVSLRENLVASMTLARAAMPYLIASRGSLVFVSSIAGREAIQAPLAYSAAKAALQAAVKSLARSVGKQGVRVNAVAPGNILFPGGSWERRLEQERESVDQYIQAEVPLQRFGSPQEVADMVVFVASPRAAFVTGATIVVDGGQTRSFS